eukprot:m.162719 g.162719  ORF g.162719 m.162719 type:complete len:57 (+) comp18079_c0_seq3:1246-1416(+)
MIECELRRLSDVLDGEDVDHIDMLKVDVEGAELDVLRGISESTYLHVSAMCLVWSC